MNKRIKLIFSFGTNTRERKFSSLVSARNYAIDTIRSLALNNDKFSYEITDGKTLKEYEFKKGVVKDSNLIYEQ